MDGTWAALRLYRGRRGEGQPVTLRGTYSNDARSGSEALRARLGLAFDDRNDGLSRAYKQKALEKQRVYFTWAGGKLHAAGPHGAEGEDVTSWRSARSPWAMVRTRDG